MEGTITAELNLENPEWGIWKYTIEFCWNSSHGLSHWDLWLDDWTNCLCEELMDAVGFGDVIGMTTSEDGCLTHYTFEWRCGNEPSIDVPGIILKFEPAGGCEPGHSGSGEFYFYSHFEPVPIAPESPMYGFLINKNSNGYCDGELTGVFPAIECDPVPAEGATWGGIKSIYIH
jgi:hypothetical protein